MRVLLDLVCFKAGWLACVLGAAGDRAWLGPLVVAILAGLHVALEKDRRRELRLLLRIALLGTVLEAALASSSLVQYPQGAQPLAWLAPLWMTALWVNFGMLLRRALHWLVGRLLLGVATGLLLGPAAYYAGMKLGAVALGPSPLLSLAVIGAVWALALPLLVTLAHGAGQAAQPRSELAASQPESRGD